MTLGEKIKFARERIGITQEELGKRCGTTKQTIYKYENGIVTNIPIDRLEKIAIVLETSSSWLLGWENTEQSTAIGELFADDNIIRIAGRDGSYQERHLTDEQMAALKAILDQLPDVPEGL